MAYGMVLKNSAFNEVITQFNPVGKVLLRKGARSKSRLRSDL